MADDDERITIDSSSASDEVTEVCDPRLDFFSDKFDPLYALTTPNVRVPQPSAKKYDNLAAFKAVMDREENPKEKVVEKQAVIEKGAMPVVRRWKEHQMPIKSTAPKKGTANLFTRMKEAKGVYTILKKCMDEKIRVKVWTRNQKNIRGYCLAYLVAYDKFWNMVLEDVTEYWSRPKKMKVPALNTLDPLVDVRKIMRDHVRPPKVKVFPHESDKKLESCVRHVDQLMIRGEQVVFVNVMESTDNNLTKSDENRSQENFKKGEKLENRKDSKNLIKKGSQIRDTGKVVDVSENEIVEISDDDSSTRSDQIKRNKK